VSTECNVLNNLKGCHSVAQKAINVNITTKDNVRLGAWFIVSDSFYTSFNLTPVTPGSSSPTLSPTSRAVAMRLYPTVLFFHGNAGSRAVSFRVSTYMSYTTRLGANVLALDYRGYADSEGTPSEEGLRQDARAAWQWVIDQGALPKDVVLVGQSLGTAVATNLAQELAAESEFGQCTSGWTHRYEEPFSIDTKPRGLVLAAPFSSLATLLETYNLGGWIPLLKPLQSIPFAQSEI
jgi:abhydrolase domain-containing protein 12